ncbi:MAG TPA: threonine synthase [Cyclobacteriaceae bacterium]|nr:threonine synthase [Cyclobacteriaceae bacterium]
MVAEKISRLTQLACRGRHKTYDPSFIQTFSDCDVCGPSPLFAEYDLTPRPPESVINLKEQSMWRYAELLPVQNHDDIVSLGEGWTPILNLKRTANTLGLNQLLLKDESLNPTGSFKARGLSAAISKAKELGISKCIIPTAGNAGVALSAYCARAGMKATVVMPTITPAIFVKECELYGSEVILVDGLIDACAKKVAQLNADKSYFDLSTMKEPYRLEGKKTMGYEVAEQLNWKLPDVILYPTGGGTGLIGIWKAFHEMIQLGWINTKLPKLIAVQSDQCQPVVRAFHKIENGSSNHISSSSLAYGLNVPKAFALQQIMDVLKQSGGDAIAVSDQEIQGSTKEIIRKEGLLICPEGGALHAALKKLLIDETISRNEKVLMLNTGSGVRYLKNF